MRSEVQTFVADGSLPGWDADERELDRRVKQIEAISAPVTRIEAQALAGCFGPDDCYGVAWSLLHLIETSPGPVPAVAPPGPDADDWHHTLWNRWGTTGSPTTT
ncbi:hypothetical protein ACFW2T_32880 [Streptomyces sp. NPDC058892]|uniref:hypothetical protein n=1 Tax=unclassified Streptomyces TaxID=2593676 RepID=UPI00044B69DC|nr:hypothetical protein [Streptomyces sp. PCS3-D2]WKV73240.1 hypothetical protein AW27_017935 [Streptomyces sp. PCS3-D2]